MSWQQWLLVGFFAFAALANITTIGEPRKPTTPNSAVVALIAQALLIWALVSI